MPKRARPARARADARRAPAGGPDRAPPDVALETADRLHSVAIHLLRRVRREDAASGLPAPRLSALSVVVFRGPLTVSDLAAAEQVRPPTMTRIVTALQEAGLVEREIDPADRRVVRVRATPRGVTVLQEGRRRRVAVLARELASLPKAELRSLEHAVGVLERIVGPRHV
jgi:DNA-binding MarR family transcriptional regulator